MVSYTTLSPITCDPGSCLRRSVGTHRLVCFLLHVPSLPGCPDEAPDVIGARRPVVFGLSSPSRPLPPQGQAGRDKAMIQPAHLFLNFASRNLKAEFLDRLVVEFRVYDDAACMFTGDDPVALANFDLTLRGDGVAAGGSPFEHHHRATVAEALA